MINIKNVTIKNNEKLIFENINLQLPDTGLVLLIGESGIGKTTFLKMLTNIYKDYEGLIEYNNKDIKTIKKYNKNICSYMDQEYNLLEELNIKNNINLYKNNNSDIYDISELSNKKITTISGGENKRASINKTFRKNANIYILDEPIESIDEENIKIFKEFIVKKSKTSLIIIASHKTDLNDIADIILNINNLTIDKTIIKDNKYSKLQQLKNKLSSKTLMTIILARLKTNIKYNLSNTILMLLIFLLSLFTSKLININTIKLEANQIINNNYNRVILNGNIEDYNYNKVYRYENNEGYIRINLLESNNNKIFYQHNDLYLISSSSFKEKIYGRRISDENEIIITEYLYDLIKEKGIKLTDNSNYKPKNISDILNKKIYLGNIEVEIVGIIKQDLSEYESLKTMTEVKTLVAQNKYYKFQDKILENNIIYTSTKFEKNLTFTDKELDKQYLYIYNQEEFTRLKKDTKYKSVDLITPYTTIISTLSTLINLARRISIIILVVLIIIVIIQLIKVIKDVKEKNKISNIKLENSGLNKSKLLNLIEVLIPTLVSIVLCIVIIPIIVDYFNKIIKLYFFIEFNIL